MTLGVRLTSIVFYVLQLSPNMKTICVSEPRYHRVCLMIRMTLLVFFKLNKYREQDDFKKQNNKEKALYAIRSAHDFVIICGVRHAPYSREK